MRARRPPALRPLTSRHRSLYTGILAGLLFDAAGPKVTASVGALLVTTGYFLIGLVANGVFVPSFFIVRRPTAARPRRR